MKTKLTESVKQAIVNSGLRSGMTISLAGNPNMNAIRITPSMPNNWAKGSRKAAQ